MTSGNHLVGDGGKPLAAFARKAKIPFHAVPSPGKPTPEAPHLHINNVNAYHSRLKQWLNRFNGVATKNLPTISAGDAPSKPGNLNSTRQNGSSALSERTISIDNAIRAVLLFGFAKSAHDNLDDRQLDMLRGLAVSWLSADAASIKKAVEQEQLIEVRQ